MNVPNWGTYEPPSEPPFSFTEIQERRASALLADLDRGLAEVGLGLDAGLGWSDGQYTGGTIEITERSLDAIQVPGSRSPGQQLLLWLLGSRYDLGDTSVVLPDVYEADLRVLEADGLVVLYAAPEESDIEVEITDLGVSEGRPAASD